MSPFDLEQGKLSVRVSEGLFYQLHADADDFNFQKPNTFFNRLLPKLIAYRNEKRKELRNFLENNIIHSVKDNFQNKFLDVMDDIFDYVYFDDDREYYHSHTLHFRLNKTNIVSLQSFFDGLRLQNQNKTSYIRNLLNDYVTMRKDKREHLCFAQEFSMLTAAIANKCIVNCTFQDKQYSLIPYKIDLNYIDGSLYLIAINADKNYICHTFRLAWLRNIVVRDIYEFAFPDKIVQKLEYIIYKYDYTGKTLIHLSRLKID